MPPVQPSVKAEREKKLKSVLAFASTLTKRLEAGCDTTLADDLHTQIRGLPLQASSAVTAKRDELEKLGTDLWNLCTRLRRGQSDREGASKEAATRRLPTLPLLRAFAFLLLDTAGGQGTNGRQRKSCIRLIKVALKAARVSIESNQLSTATKVLERAAEYQQVLSSGGEGEDGEETKLADGLRVEYYAMRTMLAWRQDRMDTAEHMFTKCKQLTAALTPATAENFADLLYEMGKAMLAKRNYEVAARWLERAYDVLGEQDLEMLSLEVGELRLSTMQSIVQAYMKLKTPDALEKAWQMVKLMEADFGDKMIVSLLKIELLSDAKTIDTTEFYNGKRIVLLRMIRIVVLNDTNFKTIMHHINKLKEHSNVTACKALDDLIDTRLFREENQTWIEKAVITRIWIGTTNNFAENTLEQLHELFDTLEQSPKVTLSAPATHAAQTLLWKKVEAACAQERHGVAEAWCRICLHPIFGKAGAQNQAKVSRKIIQCALLRHDYAAARDVYAKMQQSGRDESVTRYLMYKVGLKSGDVDFANECLDYVCRSSAKDATLLYACVMEAQSTGDKRQAIRALEKVLDKYDHGAPAGIHLPALLRCTARMLQSELTKDGNVDSDILNQLCTVFEGACHQAKASRSRPSNPAKELFTAQEFEWFSKNTYNLSLKYCAEVPPAFLVKLLNCCIEFIKLLKEKDHQASEGDLCLRLVFCEFLATCTYTTLARAEEHIPQSSQYYLEVRKHSQEFRRAAAEGTDKLVGSAQAEIVSKHFQVVKLELEAVLKLERWDELDDLFDQCWKYKSPDHYETLADLVLVIHSSIVEAELDLKYQSKTLSVLQKIINLTCRQPTNDVTKLSRWLRCLFNLSLNHDEKLSLKCIEEVTHLAAKKQGCFRPIPTISGLGTPPPSSSPPKDLSHAGLADDVTKEHERYPKTELEWLATTTFNRAVDFYLQEDDDKAKLWADKAFVIAQWMDDDGVTRDFLMARFSDLKFSAQ
ncbi:SPO22-domain-containing protein [Decorospora gaudefroyi]|uniref:Protein ZIP4 homolog n=1 Tax=Decorospora gaudefroyi TaxID=184978 RepID=A0A6A5KQQ2_9PLEO|nr:SPO22-domain-containing protein [Decorospora gaudefroyi]